MSLSRTFFISFQYFDSIRCDDFSSATFIVYHDFNSLSRTFFISCSNCFRHIRRSLSGNSISLTRSHHSVKNFFLPINPLIQSSDVLCSFRVPKYNIMFIHFLSTTFFNFFQIFLTIVFACAIMKCKYQQIQRRRFYAYYRRKQFACLCGTGK